MKNIFGIYKRDLVNIFTNYVAIIVVVALCILPSLYAWFNIKASWDPYSQVATSQIKIGVVNKDAGTVLRGHEINLGDQVIHELKENNLMGWQFVTEEEADEAVREGRYYASIMIPENFSEEITSIITSEVKKGEIIYTVNEKINAIAPKLTDKGATGVQENVNKAVIETVSKAILTLFKEGGIQIENYIPKIESIHNILKEVQGNFAKINEIVNLAYDGASKIKDLVKDIQSDIPLIQNTLTNAQGLGKEVEEFLTSSKDGVNKLAPTLKEDLRLISEIAKDISTYTNSVIDVINAGSANASELIDNLLNKVTSVKELNSSLVKILESLNKITPNKPLDGIISQLKDVESKISTLVTNLQQVKQEIANGKKPDLTLLNNIKRVAEDINSVTNSLYINFDTNTLPKINSIIDSAYKAVEDALKVLKATEENLPKVNEILSVAYEGADKGIEGITYVKNVLPEAESMVNNIVSKMDQIKNDQDIMEIVELLKKDVEARTDFLGSPVELVENKLYPMGNYGTSMTPFYTVLSLWVGLLILSSILTPHAYGSEYKPVEEYFGKLLLFLSMAIIQGLIVSVGDLYLLKIYCSNPLLFVVGTVFTAIVFTFIVYSLLSVFGNVGKVIGIILLVLQVAGSGGTFPIQLTPKFFQVINPFLPFTYAISFTREAIGGVVESVLIKDIIVMIIYIVCSILVALVLKKPINKLSHKFVEKFKESQIAEH